MKDKETSWIYPCGSGWSYCKDGFCQRYNAIKEEGGHPAAVMSQEWEEATGQEWKSDAIRKQFQTLTVRKSHGKPTDTEKLFKQLANAQRTAHKAVEAIDYHERRKELISMANLVLLTLMERK